MIERFSGRLSVLNGVFEMCWLEGVFVCLGVLVFLKWLIWVCMGVVRKSVQSESIDPEVMMEHYMTSIDQGMH